MLGEHWFKGYPGVSMLTTKIGLVAAHPATGQSFELNAIAAAVLGGLEDLARQQHVPQSWGDGGGEIDGAEPARVLGHERVTGDQVHGHPQAVCHYCGDLAKRDFLHAKLAD